MKTSESILNGSLPTGGIEVKLSLRKLTLRILLFYVLFMLAGSAAYVYIWEDFSSYRLGDYIVEFWGGYALAAILFVAVLCILLQAVLLFVANGCRLKGLRFRCNWVSAGFYYSRTPIPLKKFRVVLLLPGILLGVLPTLHGFCGGHPFVYIFGLVGIMCALGDFTLWCRLRPFHDDDLYQAGRNDLQCTIIQRNFASDEF